MHKRRTHNQTPKRTVNRGYFSFWVDFLEQSVSRDQAPRKKFPVLVSPPSSASYGQADLGSMDKVCERVCVCVCVRLNLWLSLITQLFLDPGSPTTFSLYLDTRHSWVSFADAHLGGGIDKPACSPSVVTRWHRVTQATQGLAREQHGHGSAPQRLCGSGDRLV